MSLTIAENYCVNSQQIIINISASPVNVYKITADSAETHTKVSSLLAPLPPSLSRFTRSAPSLSLAVRSG